MNDHVRYRLAERRLRAAHSRASGFNRAEIRHLLARVRYWRRSRYHSDDNLKLGLWQPLIDMACRMASGRYTHPEAVNAGTPQSIR